MKVVQLNSDIQNAWQKNTIQINTKEIYHAVENWNIPHFTTLCASIRLHSNRISHNCADHMLMMQHESYWVVGFARKFNNRIPRSRKYILLHTIYLSSINDKDEHKGHHAAVRKRMVNMKMLVC